MKTKKKKCLWEATTCSMLRLWLLPLTVTLLWACSATETPRTDNGQYAQSIATELQNTDSLLTIARATDKDVRYYLRTHTVLDNGFDIVAGFENKQKHRLDSLLQRYEQLLKATEFQALNLAGHTTHRWQEEPQRSPLNSLGTYSGDRDITGQPSGYGIFQGYDGEYYEGEWQHGERDGVGMSVTPGKRLRLGEWKDSKFLGERITYTPDRTYGIDISRYQHEQEKMVSKRVKVRRGRYVTKKVKTVVHHSIDWDRLRVTSLGTYSKKKIVGEVDYPVSFIYIKATEGTTVRNAYFATDYANSRKHGYKTGAYHFFSTRTAGKSQGYYFLQNTRYNKGDLPPVLDIEPTDAQIRSLGGVRFLFANVRGWIHVVEKKLGVKPVLYVSNRFVNKYLVQAPDLLHNYDVWIARYGEFRPDVNLISWQLCQDGRVRGIYGPVDISVMF